MSKPAYERSSTEQGYFFQQQQYGMGQPEQQPPSNTYNLGGAVHAEALRTTDGTQYVAVYPNDLPHGGGGGFAPQLMAPHEQKLLEVFALGRAIRYLALVDGVILFINCIWFPILFLFLVWAPVSGWLAGHRYSHAWAYVYVSYYLIRLAMDAAYMFMGYWWFLLIFIINVAIARYLLRYARLLGNCSSSEVEQLRSPGNPWSHAPRVILGVV